MAIGLFMEIFKARDKLKDSLGVSRYSFLFGGITARKLVNEQTAMQKYSFLFLP
jgi:hypothetical protein